MPNFIPGGADAFDALAGGRIDHSTRDWLAQQGQMVRQTLSRTGQEFMDQYRQMYQTISESAATALLRNLRGRIDNVWQAHDIYPATTLDALQTAGPLMQRYIMAHPGLRKLYLNESCEGYGPSYQNMHGNAIGRTHFDYRQVMTGVIDQKDDHETRLFTVFMDPLSDDEQPLSFSQKLDIINTWEWVAHFIDDGDDPSSVYGNKL